MAGEIKRLRDGAFGEAAKDAAIVLIGDYNLVGSRKPLDIINKAGLKDVVCNATDGSAYTWRGLKADESFWSARLDIASTIGFTTVTGHVFDTARINNDQLESFGVNSTDSSASDHLMLVVDCELYCKRF